MGGFIVLLIVYLNFTLLVYELQILKQRKGVSIGSWLALLSESFCS